MDKAAFEKAISKFKKKKKKKTLNSKSSRQNFFPNNNNQLSLDPSNPEVIIYDNQQLFQ